MSTAARKRVGRPLSDPEAGEFTQTVTFRATRQQHAAFIALGAGDWVRPLIDKARLGAAPTKRGGK